MKLGSVTTAAGLEAAGAAQAERFGAFLGRPPARFMS